MKVNVTAFFHSGRFHGSAWKVFDFPAVPRVGEVLDVSDLENQYRVTEVVWDLGAGVGIAFRVDDMKYIDALREAGWT